MDEKLGINQLYDENMSPSKHRVIRAQLGFLFRADGSCALEQGRTVVWCAINGPGDTGSSKRLNEKLHIEVIYNGLIYNGSQTNIISSKVYFS